MVAAGGGGSVRQRPVRKYQKRKQENRTTINWSWLWWRPQEVVAVLANSLWESTIKEKRCLVASFHCFSCCHWLIVAAVVTTNWLFCFWYYFLGLASIVTTDFSVADTAITASVSAAYGFYNLLLLFLLTPVAFFCFVLLVATTAVVGASWLLCSRNVFWLLQSLSTADCVVADTAITASGSTTSSCLIGSCSCCFCCRQLPLLFVATGWLLQLLSSMVDCFVSKVICWLLQLLSLLTVVWSTQPSLLLSVPLDVVCCQLVLFCVWLPVAIIFCCHQLVVAAVVAAVVAIVSFHALCFGSLW